MAKDSNIVHHYFKKEFDGFKIIVKVNPIHFTGYEITVHSDGKKELRQLEFDSEIMEDLKVDGFVETSPMEFNIYFSGLIE